MCADELKMQECTVRRVTQSPLNPNRWSLDLACGHDVWVTAKRKPTRMKMPCSECPRVGIGIPPRTDTTATDVQQSIRAAVANRDELWKSWGIVDVAARNPQVAEYCKHWEGRTARAENALKAIQVLLPEDVSLKVAKLLADVGWL